MDRNSRVLLYNTLSKDLADRMTRVSKLNFERKRQILVSTRTFLHHTRDAFIPMTMLKDIYKDLILKELTFSNELERGLLCQRTYIQKMATLRINYVST
jgi:hypothetical protein